MVLGSEDFRRRLGNEGGAPVNGLNSLQRAPENNLSLFLPCEDTMRRQLSVTQEVGHQQTAADTKPASTLILVFPASGTGGNKFLLIINHTINGILF